MKFMGFLSSMRRRHRVSARLSVDPSMKMANSTYWINMLTIEVELFIKITLGLTPMTNTDKVLCHSTDLVNSNILLIVRNFYQSKTSNTKDKPKAAENHFYSLKDFEEQNKLIFLNLDVESNQDNREDKFYEKPRENYNPNSPTEHKQVKKSAQFSRPETEGSFDFFLDEIKQNPVVNFPSFDFASNFPQFNDAGKFFENDENEKIFQVHNVHNSKPKAFVHF